MQVRDRHANEHTALKRLGGDFTDRRKGWRCSLAWTVSQKFIVIDIRKPSLK